MWFTVRPGIGVIIHRIGVRGDHIIGIIITGIIRIIIIIIMVITVLRIITAIHTTKIITTMVTVLLQIRFISIGKVVLTAILTRILNPANRDLPISIKDIRMGISLLQGQQMRTIRADLQVNQQLIQMLPVRPQNLQLIIM